MKHKIKLFETVLGIHEKGAASLTSSERSLIEAETRELLSAVSHKQAMKAPAGFEAFLSELQTAENADEAYSMILKFIKSEEGEPEKRLDKPEKSPEPPMERFDDLHEEKEEKELDRPEEGIKDLPDLEEKEHKPSKFEDKEEGMKEKKDEKKEDKKEEKKEDSEPKKDLEKDKKDLMAKIKSASEDEKKEDKEEKKEDKEEEKKEDEKKESSVLIPGNPASAAKVKVRITSTRNILATFEGKPLFHAVPKREVKENPEALKRLANKVYGWLVYEGIEIAAKKCGAKLFAGVDSDIEVAFDKEISPADEGVTESGDDVEKDAKPEPESDVRDEAEFDAQETHSKVEAGVDDDVTVVTQEKPDSTPSAVTDEEENVIAEGLDSPETDVRDEADVDFKNVEASYRKLYASRAKKMAKQANKAFVDKFVRSMKIAAKRMALNHDAHPYKAASLDVLVEAGLEEEVAHELTEQISEEGHSEFVAQLLERTAALMKKSDEYLNDLETDLTELKTKPVEVPKSSSRRSKKSENMRKAASAGNFALQNVGTPVTRSEQLVHKVGGIRAAVGDTSISRLASTMIGQ